MTLYCVTYIYILQNRKEEYSNGNSFFHLDIHNSYVESSLIAIMMDAMSEFHTDRFASNLVLNDVHIRVGSVDRTVHPWSVKDSLFFSVPMYRRSLYST